MNNNLKNHEAKLNKSKAWFTISIILLVISLFSAVILGSMIAKNLLELAIMSLSIIYINQ